MSIGRIHPSGIRHLLAFGFGSIELGVLGPVVTMAAVIAATNAFNMVDGIDGLAGRLSLVTLMSLAILFCGAGWLQA